MNAPAIGSKVIEVDPATNRVRTVVNDHRSRRAGRVALGVLALAAITYVVAWFTGANALQSESAPLALVAAGCAAILNLLTIILFVAGWVGGLSAVLAAGASAGTWFVSRRREEALSLLLVAVLLAAVWLAFTRGVPLATVALLDHIGG